MSQTGTLNSLSGVTSAKLLRGDAVLATTTSVSVGSNDPTFYTITFTGVEPGEYRLALFDSLGGVIESGLEVVVGSGSWQVKTCCTLPEQTPSQPPAIDGVVQSSIANPRRAAADGVSVESHSLPDLIQAEQHVARKSSASKPARGMRFTKLRPSGTVGELTQ